MGITNDRRAFLNLPAFFAYSAMYLRSLETTFVIGNIVQFAAYRTFPRIACNGRSAFSPFRLALNLATFIYLRFAIIRNADVLVIAEAPTTAALVASETITTGRDCRAHVSKVKKPQGTLPN
jgi:hypothetical protein